jgi:hypothetical protein
MLEYTLKGAETFRNIKKNLKYLKKIVFCIFTLSWLRFGYSESGVTQK